MRLVYFILTGVFFLGALVFADFHRARPKSLGQYFERIVLAYVTAVMWPVFLAIVVVLWFLARSEKKRT